jgi:hypothetical protein
LGGGHSFNFLWAIIVVVMWERIGEEMLMVFSIKLTNLQKHGIGANRSLATYVQ